jgi:hypothetical protein
MKLGNAVCHEYRVLNDETLGKVLVELPRLLRDRGIKDGFSFTHDNDFASVPGTYIRIHVNVPAGRGYVGKSLTGKTYDNMTLITVVIHDDLECSSYERWQQGLPPDCQQFTGQVWTNGHVRGYRCRRWELVEPKCPHHYDTDIGVLMNEIADNVADMIKRRNHK